MAGKQDKALASFEQALRLAPGNGNSLLNIATLHFELGRFNLAERFGNQAASVPENRYSALALLGKIYEKQGHKVKARAAFEESLAMSPLQPEVIRRLSRLYIAGGETPKALILYDVLIADLDVSATALLKPNRSDKDAGPGKAMALALESARRERKLILESRRIHK